MSIFYEYLAGIGHSGAARQHQGYTPGRAGREGRLANLVETVRHVPPEGERMWWLLGPFLCGMTDPPADLREPAAFPRLSPLDGAGFAGPQIEQFVGRNFFAC